MFNKTSILKSKEIGKIFKLVADENYCRYFDINVFANPSCVDGLHYDENSHRLIGNKLTEFIQNQGIAI